jgi:hypothetical protein
LRKPPRPCRRKRAYSKSISELATREKGIIKADTAAQAQAQVIQIIRRSVAENPPIDIRSTELTRCPSAIPMAKPAWRQIECHIDQLVNLPAASKPNPTWWPPAICACSSNAKEKLLLFARGTRVPAAGTENRQPRRRLQEARFESATHIVEPRLLALPVRCMTLRTN